MQVIPLQAAPSQTLQVILGAQQCDIAVYQTRYGLFLDLAVSGSAIVTGAPCEDRNRLVRSAYLGFSGDLAFVDATGTQDPDWTGLGTRYGLVYLEAADL